MASIPMPQVLKKHGLRLLAVSDENIRPGLIVARKRPRPLADLEDLLDGTAGTWPTARVAGHIVDEIAWEKNLAGKASLSIPGMINIGGGLQRAQKGTFSISKVTTVHLSRSDLMEVRLRARLQQWRKEPGHRPLWERIDEQLFVESTWFCEEYSLEFQTGSGVDVRAEIEPNIDVGASAEVKWTSKTKLKVVGNTKVPFAIRGWRL